MHSAAGFWRVQELTSSSCGHDIISVPVWAPKGWLAGMLALPACVWSAEPQVMSQTPDTQLCLVTLLSARAVPLSLLWWSLSPAPAGWTGSWGQSPTAREGRAGSPSTCPQPSACGLLTTRRRGVSCPDLQPEIWDPGECGLYSASGDPEAQPRG